MGGSTVTDDTTPFRELRELGYSDKKIKDTVKEMTDAASRYKNIEKTLGLGTVLVLGASLTESQYVISKRFVQIGPQSNQYSWTKLLPKSGPTFVTVMNHLKEIELHTLAANYETLRTGIIAYTLANDHLMGDMEMHEGFGVQSPDYGLDVSLMTAGTFPYNMDDGMLDLDSSWVEWA